MAIALIASAAAAWFAPEPGDSSVALSLQAQRGLSAQASRIGPDRRPKNRGEDVLELQERYEVGEDFVLFSVRQPEPPSLPVAVVQSAPVVVYGPPLPPPPPPLPFRALGRYVDGTVEAVFLQYQEKNLVARVGDTLAGQYMVEALEGNTLRLRYLPFDQVQTMDVGGVN